MSYIDETSAIDRKWLLDAARGPAKCTVLSNGNIRLPPARLSFSYVREPKRIEPKEPGQSVKFLYTASFIFPHELTEEDFLPLEAALDTLAEPVYGRNWRANKKLYRPLKEQAENTQIKSGERWIGYAPVGFYLSCTSSEEYPPVLQDHQGNALADTSKFVNGNWVLPIVNPYLMKSKENQGVTVGLNGCVFLAEDKKLGGGSLDTKSAAAGLDGLSAPPPVFGGGLIED